MPAMTRDEMLGLLTERFYENFADEMAARVCDADAVGQLYELVAQGGELPRNVRHRVAFRGAYVLERIFFEAPELFEPCVGRFVGRDFAACADASARRHFGKIMAHLLRERLSDADTSASTDASADVDTDALERIADAAADWAVDPRSKVAVRIWAVEVLKCCRERVAWVAESWDDVLQAMENDPTPAICNRIRKSWRNS